MEMQIRNWAVIGESGCGKTEVSIYLAKTKSKETAKHVTLIDMDQTKGMFRSRDFTNDLQTEGIEVISGAHFMDMPVIPHGIERLLLDEDAINILDAGGNEIGAVSLGQFSDLTNAPNMEILYLVNPYRSFSRAAEDIRQLMEGIQSVGHVEQVTIFCNPNLGAETSEQEILEGYARLEDLLLPLGLRPQGLVIPNWVDKSVFSGLKVPVWCITPCIEYP